MTLVLSQLEVRALLPMERCIALVEDAMKALARGDAVNPLRWPMRLPDGSGLLGLMPGATTAPDTLGLKVVAIFPANHGTELDSHQGVVVLFDKQNGVPLAILDASEVTAIRTAAASALATRLLARPDAAEVAVIGSGVQARTHLEAMCAVRPVRGARVFSRSEENRRAFAKRESERLGIPVEAVSSAREAVDGASIVCTTTSSREPVVRGEWLAPGTHINAAGACQPTARELDSEAVRRSRLYTDARESLVHEAGDYLMALEEGAIDAGHLVGEIGEVLLGRAAGRASPEDITLYESLGVAVQDLVVGNDVFLRARAEGVGTEVALGGRRD